MIVALSAIDAAEDLGHGVSEVAGAGQMLAGPTAAPNASGDSRSSLTGLAEATGGRLFVGGPELGDSLAAARRYLVTFYALGYRPSDANDERVRRVEVRVRVPESVEPAAFQPVVLQLGHLFSQPGIGLAIR